MQYENYQKIVKKELDKKINNNDNNTNIPNTTGGIGIITDRSGNSKEDELTHRTGLIKDIQCNNDSNNNNNKVSTSNKPIAITTELKDIPIKHKKTNNNQIALTTTTAKQIRVISPSSYYLIQVEDIFFSFFSCHCFCCFSFTLQR